MARPFLQIAEAQKNGVCVLIAQEMCNASARAASE
jgi:hypothetical protein